MLNPTIGKLITQPVRSGQQIYARGGDLVVCAPVSPGAELLADGHIHVYGPLRGRALSGVLGNVNAYIFCQSLEAELISVAGQYRISENLKDTCWKQPAKIYLQEGHLQIQTL
jgi:septum site-determining protein MinC